MHPSRLCLGQVCISCSHRQSAREQHGTEVNCCRRHVEVTAAPSRHVCSGGHRGPAHSRHSSTRCWAAGASSSRSACAAGRHLRALERCMSARPRGGSSTFQEYRYLPGSFRGIHASRAGNAATEGGWAPRLLVDLGFLRGRFTGSQPSRPLPPLATTRVDGPAASGQLRQPRRGVERI